MLSASPRHSQKPGRHTQRHHPSRGMASLIARACYLVMVASAFLLLASFGGHRNVGLMFADAAVVQPRQAQSPTAPNDVPLAAPGMREFV